MFVEGDEFVDRLYHALRDSGLSPERYCPVREANVEYVASLALPCREGVLSIEIGDEQPDRTENPFFAPSALYLVIWRVAYRPFASK